MKYRLLELLQCPNSGGSLKLQVFKSDENYHNLNEINSVQCKKWCERFQRNISETSANDCTDCYRIEIEEGKLISQDGYEYPIIGGIPRLLPENLISETLISYHIDFLEKYNINLPGKQENSITVNKKVRTLHAFGYQWTTFKNNFEYFKSIFLSFIEPYLEAKDFKDKLVLEVGCGSGRPASVASSFGAEVVAVDLSEAVKTAYSMTSQFSKLHVVQADAYTLPFKPCFDFVYSVGVLQHIPDPKKALKSISRVIPDNNKLILWIYGVREFWYQPIEWLRKLTTRMPYKFLRALSYFLAVLSELLLLCPYRVLRKFNFSKPLAEKIPGRIYANFPFKENVLGWFDRLVAPVTHYFSKSDVEDMLLDAGFNKINIVARTQASASWVVEASKVDESDISN